MVQKKKTRAESRRKKYALWTKLWDCVDKFKKVIVVQCSNITANVFHDLRKALRPLRAVILMGKNTLLQAAMSRRIAAAQASDEDYETRKKMKVMPELEKLSGLCKGYQALIFCNDNLSEVKDILGNFKCTKGAKVGAVAPSDVFIQPGPTGLDPKQTAFFQALNIQTKIVRTQIEIISSGKIISAGQKIGASECALLDKLNIRPFSFTVTPVKVYDNGAIYDPSVLDIKPADIIAKLIRGANYLTAAALESGYPTELSARQMVLSGFKNLLALAVNTSYNFKEAEAMKASASSADAPKPKAAKAPKEPKEAKPDKKEAKVAEVKKEPEPEAPKEPEVSIGGIFDD